MLVLGKTQLRLVKTTRVAQAKHRNLAFQFCLPLRVSYPNLQPGDVSTENYLKILHSYRKLGMD